MWNNNFSCYLIIFKNKHVLRLAENAFSFNFYKQNILTWRSYIEIHLLYIVFIVIVWKICETNCIIKYFKVNDYIKCQKKGTIIKELLHMEHINDVKKIFYIT